MIECLTDNKNRALAEIKTILNKLGGSMATSGAVSYLFKKVGQIIIDIKKQSSGEAAKQSKKSNDEIEEAIIDSGADDFEKDENYYIVTGGFAELHSIKKKLEDAGIVIESAEAVHVPSIYIDLPEDKKEIVEKILEQLDDLDDINNVYSNANL